MFNRKRKLIERLADDLNEANSEVIDLRLALDKAQNDLAREFTASIEITRATVAERDSVQQQLDDLSALYSESNLALDQSRTDRRGLAIKLQMAEDDFEGANRVNVRLGAYAEELQTQLARRDACIVAIENSRGNRGIGKNAGRVSVSVSALSEAMNATVRVPKRPGGTDMPDTPGASAVKALRTEYPTFTKTEA